MTTSTSDQIRHAVARAAEDGSTNAVVDAICSIAADSIATFFHARLDTDETPIATGTPASPGAASGRIALTADHAIAGADAGHAMVLVRPETTPDDVLGMQAASGILTARGGTSSHAAVVARGWGIPAVVGAAELTCSATGVTIAGHTLRAGDEITVDGSTGAVYRGALTTTAAAAPDELDTLLRWADHVADGVVQVRANADTGADAEHARSLGARGIGLCRTEHMFLEGARLASMRRFILAGAGPDADAALAELQIAQTADFRAILLAMDGLPVTVRLLDPPLHEFLPDLADLIRRDARGTLDADGRAEFAAVQRLHESNPMLGVRGVRLGVLRSGVYEMQVRALTEAAADLIEDGREPVVEIMIPLVVDAEELRIARGWVTDVLDEIGHPELAAHAVTVGAMIETPRAALTADALADHADFFSFGTNDLTQLTYAFSRDDVEATLVPAYVTAGIITDNPFARLDPDGVGELVRLACERARRAKPQLKLGACGEHAGDPVSIDFLVRQGLDAVSCSPYRVPVARLAVAQALIVSRRVDTAALTFDTTRTALPGRARAVDVSSDVPGTLEIDETLVLHVLRLRGFLTPDAFVESLGEFPAELVAGLVDAELVRHIEARDMYALLPAGRERHEACLAESTGDELRSALHPGYEQFLEINSRFKQLCTEWQVRDSQPNDHTDTAYDRRCIDALSSLVAEAQPVIADMAVALPRFGRYTSRLDTAARCVAAGETKRFTGVMCESFHDVWMELHEDLIVLQGIDRTAEGSF